MVEMCNAVSLIGQVLDGSSQADLCAGIGLKTLWCSGKGTTKRFSPPSRNTEFVGAAHHDTEKQQHDNQKSGEVWM